jgi:hypothetical protein
MEMGTSLTDSDFDYWQFLMDGRFDDALKWFEKRQPHWTAEDWREPSARGTVYLCLREYDKAAAAMSLANAMSVVSDRQKEGPFLNKEGGALWLAGKKNEGTAVWQRSVRGLLDGTIAYADFSGGISNGLLLWYAGVSLNRKDLIADSKKFLKKASKRVASKSMPGPLAHFVLHGKPVAEILQEKYGESDLGVLEKRAMSDTLLRRELCQVFLCLATGKRLAGEEGECLKLMRRCSNLKNPLVEIEWYLARGEAEKH